MAKVEFSVEFNVEEAVQGSEWATYKEFIESLRNQLKADDGAYSHQRRPVLPPPENPPTRWFDIILRTKSQAITLRIRRGNLHVDAYQIETSREWLEFGSGSPQFIPGSTSLEFTGAYHDLERVAGAKIDSLALGQQQLCHAVNGLAVPTSAISTEERAQALITVILMICESIKFDRISKHLASAFHLGLPPPQWMLPLVRGWEDLSAALLRADADAEGRFFLPQPNDMGMVTAEEAVAQIGILFGAARASPLNAEVNGSALAGQGKPLAEVYWVRVNNIDNESPGDLYGKIKAIDGLGTQYVYNRARSDSESIYPGQNAKLNGPTARAISASGSFTLDLDLWDRDRDASSDDEVAKGQIHWSSFGPSPDENFNQDVTGKHGSVTVNYAVYRNAVEAVVEVTLIDGDGEDPADVYGVIGVRNNKYTNESLIFNIPSNKDYVNVRPGQLIPLTRPITAVPLDSSLIVRALLYDYDTTSADDEIANGTVEFPAQISGQSQEKKILGKYGEIRVKVTWRS